MWIIGSILMVLLVAVDQWSKYWAETTLSQIGSIPVWDGVFHLTYAQNTGAAFSLLEGQRWFFIVMTVVLVGVMIFLLARGALKNNWGKLAVFFVLAGAIGNFIDRVRFGYVIDMFEFRFVNFAIFNVADVCLVTGTCMMIIYILFMDRAPKAKTSDDAAH